MIDLVHLRSFAEVAERGTVVAAAEALGYTGPAVSQHVAKLEAGLGTRLFDRVGGRLSPTDAGVALLPIALDLLDLEAQAATVARQPEQRPPVVFAGFASAISSVLAPRLDALGAIADLTIREAEDADAVRDLGLGHVDIVLTQEYDGIPADRVRRFTYTSLDRDRLVLVLPPDRSIDVTVGDLTDEPWLLNGSTTRCAQATQQVLARHGVSPHVVATVADNGALLELVAAGLGVTVVPNGVLAATSRRVTIAAQDLGVGRTILAVTRTATTASLNAVLDVLTRSPGWLDVQPPT